MSEKKEDMGPSIRVRALEKCYYKDQRIKPGDEFVLTPHYKHVQDKLGRLEINEDGEKVLVLVTAKQQFSVRNMEKVDAKESKKEVAEPSEKKAKGKKGFFDKSKAAEDEEI